MLPIYALLNFCCYQDFKKVHEKYIWFGLNNNSCQIHDALHAISIWSSVTLYHHIVLQLKFIEFTGDHQLKSSKSFSVRCVNIIKALFPYEFGKNSLFGDFHILCQLLFSPMPLLTIVNKAHLSF